MGSSEQPRRWLSWARPLVFLSALVLILYASILQIPNFHLAGHVENHSTAAQHLSEVVSLDGSTAAETREDLAKVLKTTSDFLDALSSQYQLDSLKGLSKDLRRHAANAHKSSLISVASKEIESRGFLEDLAGLAKGTKGSGAGSATGMPSAAVMSGLTGIFGNLLGGIGNIAAGALAGPAQFLGDGVGRGVTSGLNVTNNAQTTPQKPSGINAIADNLGFGLSNALAGSLDLSKIATPGSLGAVSDALGSGLGGGAATGLKLNTSAIAASNNTGIALIAGNLGNGLTSSFFTSADLSGLMTGISGTQLASAITSAGKGLGEGAAQGLKLPQASQAASSTVAKRAAASGTGTALDIPTVAFDFTKSLSSSFLGYVDLSKIASSATAGMSNLTSMIAPSLVSAGSGFGSGAAVSLGLQNEVATTTPPDAAAPVVAKNFAYELTTSFLANGTLPALQKQISSTGLTNVSMMIGPAAQGLGSGIGQGVAVGLGLQDASTVSTATGGDVAMVARGFSFGVTSSFLSNGTLPKLLSLASSLLGNSTSSLSLRSIDISKVAEGAARGLIDGAGNSINNAGGVKAIFGGANVTNPMSSSTNVFGDSSGFNDSVDGAATGFGYGLGAEGLNVVLEVLGKKAKASTATSTVAPPETTGNLSTVAMRNLASSKEAYIAKRDLALRKRSPVTKRAIDLSGIFAMLNTTDANALIQKGVNSLTCEGIGGATQVLIGLKSSHSLPTNVSLPPGILPNATFTITNGGNTFKIDPGNFGIFVNGLTATKVTILVVIHAFLVILAYFVFIPLALLVEYGHAIAVLVLRPQRWVNAPRWKLFIWGLGVIPLAIVGFILGIVLLGSARHFITPHGIIGLITTLLLFIAAALELPMVPSLKGFNLFRFANMSLLIVLSVLAFITGFIDVQRISLCTVQLPDAAFMIVSILVMLSLVSGVTVVIVWFILRRWMGSGDIVDEDMRGRLIEKSKSPRPVEIQHRGEKKRPDTPSLSDPNAYERQ